MKQLSCILIALAIVGVYGDEPDKLVNGIPANINDYPHCISMRMNGNHMCGGSLIDKQYVLTAAHCLVSLKQNPSLLKSVTVFTGTTYLNSGGQAHKIANVWYHESYDPNFPSGRGPYDIGLIKLAAPVQFGPTQQPIKLPTRNIAKDDSVTIAAWGSTGFRKAIHNNLQKLHAKAMLPDLCQQYHKNSMPIHSSNEFCTLITYGTGLCNGDSGSGLIRDTDNTIVGLVSGGRPCALGYPDVYTNVYSYISWIKQKMNSY
ncbi:PREDICTED: chymotrypsin-1-like [Vollenhovia emeryi]|uniref:chymotrypsin-1-like n=1 Tax=Vollenhovia emeryi TaxID=411798 RepID=UPI0005F54256|nr:PREDICTED: chymotrypsin-1-like [Vollenhovia emeryi]